MNHIPMSAVVSIHKTVISTRVYLPNSMQSNFLAQDKCVIHHQSVRASTTLITSRFVSARTVNVIAS